MKAFIKFINTLGNIIILNILFVLTSVLSIGLCIGTSLSALYATFLDLKTDDLVIMSEIISNTLRAILNLRYL